MVEAGGDGMTRFRRRAVAAAAALILGALIGGCGSDDPPAADPATDAAAPTSAPTPPAGRVAILPARVPGYVIAAPGLDSYRLSLVFRLRNTILNGLPGPASDYAVETVQATRRADTALLIGIGARTGADPPPIAAGIRRQIGSPAVRRLTLSGLPAEIHATSGTELVLLTLGRDRAAIAMGGDPASALALARAVARAVAGT